MSTSRALTSVRLRRTVRRIAGVFIVLALLGAVYAGYVFVRHQQPVGLPLPTGRYAVGRALYTWTDASRTDPLSPSHPAGPRRLSVWVWFPSSAPKSAGPRAAYLPGAWSGMHFPGALGWAETDFGKVDAHTLAETSVAPGRFPLVVLLPGLGFAAPQYSSTAVDLASHGLVVAGVTPTYSANLTVLDGRPVRASDAGDPSGFSGDHTSHSAPTALRLMRVWADDAIYAAHRVAAAAGGTGRLARHVDTARVAYIGHSFGGTSALEACRRDTRCVAAENIDGGEFGPVVAHGLRQPLLLVGHEGSCTTTLCRPAGPSDHTDLSVARRLVSHSHGHAWGVNVDGTKHFDFTDYASYYIALPLRIMLPLGSIDGDRALRITDAYTTRFLTSSFMPRAGNKRLTQLRFPETHARAW